MQYYFALCDQITRDRETAAILSLLGAVADATSGMTVSAKVIGDLLRDSQFDSMLNFAKKMLLKWHLTQNAKK